MKKTKIALSLLIAAGLAGCAGSFEISEESKYGDLSPDRVSAMQVARGTTFVREIKSEDLAKQRLVNLTAQGKSLRSVLQQTLPGYAIIPRGPLNLNEPIDVAARGMTVGEFIEYIEGTRDLNIEIEGNRVYVSNFETREWNLAAFAATRSVTTLVTSVQTAGASAGNGDSASSDAATTGSSVGYTLTEDEWLKIIEGARKIIGAPADGDSAPVAPVADSSTIGQGSIGGSTASTVGGGLNFDSAFIPEINDVDKVIPYVEGIRSVGVLTAGGSPAKMRVLDRFLKRAIGESTKIINVQVEAFDVVLKDNIKKGIDWSAIVDGTLNSNPFGLVLDQAASAITSGTDPFWNVQGNYASSNFQGDFLLKFLETFGRVELKDQPNLTVRNGVPAQIYAGEELTYIVDVEQAQDEAGNVTVTPKLGRLKVGVTLSVTVRVLDDEQLLVDIMPVISNLNAPDVIQIGAFAFETPRVALKEFSTQLITSSGKSVHLGGLITERMEKALEQLPWQNFVTKAVLNPLTQNINNGIERRELVLVVTPTLIEGVY